LRAVPPQREQLVLDAAGVVRLGEQLAVSVLSDLRVGGAALTLCLTGFDFGAWLCVCGGWQR